MPRRRGPAARVARAAVVGFMATVLGCRAPLPPGEVMRQKPEDTFRGQGCAKKELPYFKVQRDVIAPHEVAPGESLRHTFSYWMCPATEGEAVTGTLHRRVKQHGQVVLDDATEGFQVKPGFWIVTALIKVPPDAPKGDYALGTQLRAGKLAYENEQGFRVK